MSQTTEPQGKGDALCIRITDYLKNGGLWNPESMEHDKVRDLLLDCREFLGRRVESPAVGDALHALIYYLRGNDECLTDGLNNMRYVIAGQIEAAQPGHDAAIRSEALAMAAEHAYKTICAEFVRGWKEGEPPRCEIVSKYTRRAILSLAPNPAWLAEHDAQVILGYQAKANSGVPGMWMCPTCEYQLVAPNKSDDCELCPNDGARMVPLTWEMACKNQEKYIEDMHKRFDERIAQVRLEYEEAIPHDSECQLGQWNSSLQMTMDCTCGKIERVARLKPPIGGKA